MPKVMSYEEAVAVPVFTDREGVFRTGVVAGGATLKESLYWRGGRKQRYRAVPPESIDSVDEIDREVIYAGHIIDQFGHFILDSLSRLWFAKQRPDLPMVWMNSGPYKGYQKEILDLVGIHNSALFLEKPARFRTIHVPDTGFTQDFPYPKHFDDFLSQVEPAEIVPGRRCWLSRSKLAARNGRVLGEEIIEREAGREGWIIYHPEQHSVTDQLEFLSSCEDIAGWSGSAFHTVVLLKKVLPRLHIIARGTHFGSMFRIIADQKGFQQSDHVLDLELISGSRGKGVWKVASVDNVLEILKDISLR
jgi:capsular polysaccharide biosynthesis protein